MTHPVTKNLVFLGRADGVLNPSGVRFGSAEIYGVLEGGKFPMLSDSICVGQRRPQDQDESVMLFLLMKPGEEFTQKLVNDVKAAIREALSPRHVPKYVFETPEIPVSFLLSYSPSPAFGNHPISADGEFMLMWSFVIYRLRLTSKKSSYQ